MFVGVNGMVRKEGRRCRKRHRGTKNETDPREMKSWTTPSRLALLSLATLACFSTRRCRRHTRGRGRGTSCPLALGLFSLGCFSLGGHRCSRGWLLGRTHGPGLGEQGVVNDELIGEELLIRHGSGGSNLHVAGQSVTCPRTTHCHEYCRPTH